MLCVAAREYCPDDCFVSLLPYSLEAGSLSFAKSVRETHTHTVRPSVPRKAIELVVYLCRPDGMVTLHARRTKGVVLHALHQHCTSKLRQEKVSSYQANETTSRSITMCRTRWWTPETIATMPRGQLQCFVLCVSKTTLPALTFAELFYFKSTVDWMSVWLENNFILWYCTIVSHLTHLCCIHFVASLLQSNN